MARREDGDARVAAQGGARATQGAGLNDGRKIRFSKEEWDAATACGEADYGGMRPSSVVRTALRLFLKKRGYLG